MPYDFIGDTQGNRGIPLPSIQAPDNTFITAEEARQLAMTPDEIYQAQIIELSVLLRDRAHHGFTRMTWVCPDVWIANGVYDRVKTFLEGKGYAVAPILAHVVTISWN